MTASTQPAGAREVLRAAIQDYLDGNYDSPRSHRPQPCRHGQEYYQPCEACIDEHFQKALAAALALPPSDEVAELRAERDEARRLNAEYLATPVGQWVARATAAEAQRDALRERVRVLKEALRPFVIYAEAFLHDGMEGEFGEVYKDGFRVSIHTRDLRRAQAALVRQSQAGGETDDG